MAPFRRDQVPLPQPDSVQQIPDNINGLRVSTPSSKTNSNSSSKSGSYSQVGATLPSPAEAQSVSATHEFGQLELVVPPEEERSPPPHYTPTYVDRATQTSPMPAPHPFFHAVQDPYAHAYPYPVAFQYNQHHHPYAHPMPWLPAPRPFLFPAVPDQGSHLWGARATVSVAEQREQRIPGPANNAGTALGISTGVPAISYPFYSYYSYSHPPPQAISHRSVGSNRLPRDISPLIAPLPTLPLPSPASFPLVSEPSSPVVPLNSSLATTSSITSVTSLSASFVPARSMSTPPSRRTTSPVENPFHFLYKSFRSLLLLSEPDPCFLAREVTGEQLVNVHGVGVWSYRGNAPTSVEDAKRTAFKSHGSYDAWLHAARARTAHYASPGAIRPPLRWVLVEGRGSKYDSSNEQDQGGSRRHKRKKDRVVLPDDALQTGTEANGEKLYCARAWWEGGVHLGKAAAHLQDGGASLSYGSIEHSLSTFEILVGDKQYAKWVDVPHGTVLDFPPSGEDMPSASAAPSTPASASDVTPGTPRPALPVSFTPIEGGREADGAPLFVAQAEYERGWHPGKARLGQDYCCIAYGGGELWVKGFRVLGYIV